MSIKEQKWGYRGTETAINGLINWLSKQGYYTSGKYMEFVDKACKIILEYADAAKLNYRKVGNLQTKADNAAKIIQENFNAFAKWVKENKQP